MFTCSAYARHICSKIISKMNIIRCLGCSLNVKSTAMTLNAFCTCHIVSLFGATLRKKLVTKWIMCLQSALALQLATPQDNDLLDIFNFNNTVFKFNVCALVLILKSVDYVDSPYFKLVQDDIYYDTP